MSGIDLDQDPHRKPPTSLYDLLWRLVQRTLDSTWLELIHLLAKLGLVTLVALIAGWLTVKVLGLPW